MYFATFYAKYLMFFDEFNTKVVTFIATIQFDLQITCHGKTRVNGGRQKAKTAEVLMNLSRLRHTPGRVH